MSKDSNLSALVVGAGIGGCALALALHQVGVRSRILESVPKIKPLGVGLNLLPHAVRDLAQLGLEDQIAGNGIPTKELCFYTSLGQQIYVEPRGRFAGYKWPQISIHRGDLHAVLIDAVRQRLGYDAIALGHRCVGVEQDAGGATVHLADPEGRPLPDVRGSFVVCCDGVHSVARERMHPNEAVPRYEGTTQYRGVTRWKSFLSGASMVYFGVKETGKLIIYPIRDNVDAEGHQLVNWVIEVVRPSQTISGGDADAGTQVLAIGRDREGGLGRCLEQQIVDRGLVLVGDIGDRPRQRKHQVEVWHGQQFGLALGEPLLGGGALTFGAMSVAA